MVDPYWNGEAAAADAAKIVAEHQKMWAVPYKRYHFFNLIAESGGGLEHNNSTVLLTSRWAFRNEKNYKKWLGLSVMSSFMLGTCDVYVQGTR